jgi:hypothetical protein
VKDLSHLAKDSLTVTSQAGGNMSSSSKNAMTAPGSEPVDPVQPASKQGDPALDIPATAIKPGTNGKPQASGQQDRTAAPAPAWKKTA